MKNVLIRYSAQNYASRCVLTGVQKFIAHAGDWITRIVSFPELLTGDMVRRASIDGCDGILFPDVRRPDVARAVEKSLLPVSLSVDVYKYISRRKNAISTIDLCDEEVGRIGARHFLKLGNFKSYAFVPHPIAALAKPSAIMASYDYKAIEIIGYARKAGFEIPKQIAVIGVDADPIVCGFSNPSLTSVEPDFERAGYAAAAALDAMMRGQKLKGVNKVICKPKGMVERASTYFLPTGQTIADQAQIIIANEATKGLSVNSLAARLHVSPQYLSLRFRQFFHMSPREMILQTRLENVKQMLTGSEARPNSIAAQCGFNSANRLFHLFKERFGVTMRAYSHSRKRP